MDAQYLTSGAVTTKDVDASFLGEAVRVRLLRHAMRMYQANQRLGTHSVKRRSELHYRRAALFKQKGTGRARVRHHQATQCRHGGKPMGPKPRDYSYQMPRRAKFEALRSALLSKFRDGEVGLIDAFGFAAPKTKALIDVLDTFGFKGSCLLVVEAYDANLLLSARNLRRVQVQMVNELNAHDLLRCRNVIMTSAALDIVREKCNEA